MHTQYYSEEKLKELESMPKKVENPGARWLKKPRERPVHHQRDFQVFGKDKDKLRYFRIYQRQNLLALLDFSCGISYMPLGIPVLTLARYNGPNHQHGNIKYRPHIHRASEQAIKAGRKPESEAEETNRFISLEGALYCLMQDFNISGLHAEADEAELFP